MSSPSKVQPSHAAMPERHCWRVTWRRCVASLAWPPGCACSSAREVPMLSACRMTETSWRIPAQKVTRAEGVVVRLLRARRVILQPRHVLVVGTARPVPTVPDVSMLDYRHRRAGIHPLVELGMAVGKGKPAGLGVIGSGYVVHLVAARVGR